MPSISVSKYATLRTCPRLFYWEYVVFMERARQDGARGFGQLYHKGLEAWWMHAGEGNAPWAKDRIDAPLVHALKAIGDNSRHVDTDKYEVAKAEVMMLIYHATYMELEYTRVGEGVEVYYEVPLRDPEGKEVKGWKQVGKKDAIIHFADQRRPRIVEHKTTTSDMVAGTDYWLRLSIDLQTSAYIDSARAGGIDVQDALFDVSRKPQVSPELTTPELTTPEDKRTMTKGKGCTKCGGRAGGKGGVLQGAGKIETKHPTDAKLTIEVTCEACRGTGWKHNEAGESEGPRYSADVNLEDEKVEDFKARVHNAILKNPNAHFRQAAVPRTDDQLAEARADLVAASVEIDGYYDRARAAVHGSHLKHPQARQKFPRNTNTCTNIYGRRCDFLDACAGQIDPFTSPLYRIKEKQTNKVIG